MSTYRASYLCFYRRTEPNFKISQIHTQTELNYRLYRRASTTRRLKNDVASKNIEKNVSSLKKKYPKALISYQSFIKLEIKVAFQLKRKRIENGD